VLRGFYEGLEMPVDRTEVVIGRGRGADIVIAEPTMSAHTRRRLRRVHFFFPGLGSTNRHARDGKREQKAVLRDGDEVQLASPVA